MKKLWGTGFILGSVFAAGLFFLVGRVIAATYMSQDVNYPIYIDNVIFTPSTPAQNVQGSTYLPLRAMSEALGVEITWDASARRVDVYKNKTKDTLDIPDMAMWEYILSKSNSPLAQQQSSASSFNISDSSDEYQIQLLYYKGKTLSDAGSQLEGKLNVNFTKGTFELMLCKDENVVNYSGSIDNSFNTSNINKDGGSDSDCKSYVKEKLDEYRKVYLEDKWNLNLVGHAPSEMKMKNVVDYYNK